MSAAKRVLYVDATAGASGDMILGALVDAGVPLARVRAALSGLPLSGWKIGSRTVRRAGLAGRKVDVRVEEPQPARTWRDLERIVRGGGLEPGPRDRALAVFRRLIEAEAEVHGEDPERVHLHEVGAADAIVDVVGACVALAHLAPRRIVVSPMTTGFGTVRCEHGLYPVPAPATALLVRGAPVRAGEVEGERLTPTGAAILTTVADAWGRMPAMRPSAVGHGAGARDLGEVANFLRVIVGEEDAPARDADPEVAVIEFAVDDATPQSLAFAVERLHEAGALDVLVVPVLMKKGRAGHQVTVLAPPASVADLGGLILRETTTLGLRYRTERRMELARSVVRVDTPFGAVRVKVARHEDRAKAWPEYDDCAALSRSRGVPLREVQQAALSAYAASAAREPRTPGAARERDATGDRETKTTRTRGAAARRGGHRKTAEAGKRKAAGKTGVARRSGSARGKRGAGAGGRRSR